MKKRRTTIIAFLLVAALALGIGYAALTTNLTITGGVTNAPHPINVVFQSGTLKEATATGENASATQAAIMANSSVVCTEGAQSATFNAANLVHQGDTVTATFVIQNRNLYGVKLDDPVITETDASGLFTATTAWDGYTAGDTLAANATATFTVTVTLDKNTAETLTGDFVVTITATSVE